IGEKIRRGEIKFQILDILVEHKSSLYMADTADFVIDGVAIRPEMFILAISGYFRKKGTEIAEGWQKIILRDIQGNPIDIPEELADSKMVEELDQDYVERMGTIGKIFSCSKTVSLHNTDVEGKTSVIDYLTWYGEAREKFLLRVMPKFKEAFASGLRILTHDTYIKNYSSATFNEKVSVRLNVGKVSPASAKLFFAIMQGNEKLAEGWQTLVFSSAQTGKVIRVPEKGLYISPYLNKID
ncbi:MAG: thioesterase family protein, partial [Candidatus Paceibacterota bacterium]